MGTSFQFGKASAVVLLAAACSLAAAQEAPRSLTGTLTSGYSALTAQRDTHQGPYVGVDSTLAGFWKDPRILHYDLQGSYESGFQWAGPYYGPQARGFTANVSFLQGSNFPLSFNFSRLSIPSPEINLGNVGPVTQRFVSVSRLRRDWGLDWMLRPHRWYPSFHVRYSNTSDDDQFPEELGGNVNVNVKNLWLETGYKFAGWELGARFADVKNETDSALLSSQYGTSRFQSTSDRSLIVDAHRALPLRSHLSLTAEQRNSDYDLGEGNSSNNDYKRFSGTVSSNPWTPLTLTASESYVSSYADYIRSQFLSTGTPGTPGPLLVAPTETATLTNMESATLAITKNLRANGSFSWTAGLPTSNAHPPETRSVGGGLSYTRSVFGGNAGASYSYLSTSSTYGVSADDTEYKLDANTHSMAVSYGRALPWAVRMTAGAGAAVSAFTSQVRNDSTSGNMYVELARRLARWQLSARTSYNRQVLDATTDTTASGLMFSMTASSRRLQLTVADSYNTNFAYFFGNDIVTAPSDLLNVGLIPGLPYSTFTTGNTLSASGTWQATDRLFVRGAFSRGGRSATGADSSSFTAYNFGLGYRLRQLKLSAGYASTFQSVAARTNNWQNRQFYFQISRDFKIF